MHCQQDVCIEEIKKSSFYASVIISLNTQLFSLVKLQLVVVFLKFQLSFNIERLNSMNQLGSFWLFYFTLSILSV